MKSFKYAGGCLVRCPRSRESGVLAGGSGVVTNGDGALTGGLLCSTGGVSGLLVTVVSSPRSPDLREEVQNPPRGEGGFALPGPTQVPEVVALDLALGVVGALPLTEVAFPASPSLLPTA